MTPPLYGRSEKPLWPDDPRPRPGRWGVTAQDVFWIVAALVMIFLCAARIGW